MVKLRSILLIFCVITVIVFLSCKDGKNNPQSLQQQVNNNGDSDIKYSENEICIDNKCYPLQKKYEIVNNQKELIGKIKSDHPLS